MGHWGVMKVPYWVVELCSGSMWEDYIRARPQANQYMRTLGCSSSQRVSETASILAVPEEWPPADHHEKKETSNGKLRWY